MNVNRGHVSPKTPTGPLPAVPADPRENQHVRCDCVPELGPPHCHRCSQIKGTEVTWDECAGEDL